MRSLERRRKTAASIHRLGMAPRIVGVTTSVQPQHSRMQEHRIADDPVKDRGSGDGLKVGGSGITFVWFGLGDEDLPITPQRCRQTASPEQPAEPPLRF